MMEGEVDVCQVEGGCSWPRMEEVSLEANAMPL